MCKKSIKFLTVQDVVDAKKVITSFPKSIEADIKICYIYLRLKKSIHRMICCFRLMGKK